VQSHIGDRRKEAVRAELLVDEEVRKFEERAQTADVVPTIVSLQQHLENLRQAELDRVRGRLGNLTPEQEMAVEALSKGIINKIMHTPITTLKSAARDPESTTVVDVVRKLFNLRVEEPIDPVAASAVPAPEPEQSAASVAASAPPAKQKLG
jgi:glutamyl-tRNA reductase